MGSAGTTRRLHFLKTSIKASAQPIWEKPEPVLWQWIFFNGFIRQSYAVQRLRVSKTAKPEPYIPSPVPFSLFSLEGEWRFLISVYVFAYKCKIPKHCTVISLWYGLPGTTMTLTPKEPPPSPRLIWRDSLSRHHWRMWISGRLSLMKTQQKLAMERMARKLSKFNGHLTLFRKWSRVSRYRTPNWNGCSDLNKFKHFSDFGICAQRTSLSVSWWDST